MELQLIKQRIYTIRGQKAMLDFDLAELYGVQTKVFKQAVKRNIRRFPSDFLFELSKDEFDFLRSQSVTSKGRGGMRYLPYAFTEQGVAMLSSILNSDKAIEMNIAIVRSFIALRQITLQHYDIAGKVSEIQSRLGEHDTQLAAIYDTIETLLDKKVDEEAQRENWENRERIGFKKED